MSYRWPRWASILVVVVTSLAAAAIVAVPSIRESVLRAAGWALVVNEPIAPASRLDCPLSEHPFVFHLPTLSSFAHGLRREMLRKAFG
jgi:hypothetical protein